MYERVSTEMQGQVEDGALEVVAFPTKQPYPLCSDPFHPLGPQFSLFVGGDCVEGWGEDTVNRTLVCRERLWGWEER